MNLKQLRLQNGLTQTELSELTDIPFRTIQSIEYRKDCKVSTAIKLAKALNVTLDELCLNPAE